MTVVLPYHLIYLLEKIMSGFECFYLNLEIVAAAVVAVAAVTIADIVWWLII